MTDELQAPAEMSLAGAVEAIGGTLTVREGRPHTRTRSYYDTFDRRLRDAGLALWHEQGQLVLGERRQPVRRPTRPLLLGDLAPGPLREALAPVLEMRALLPLGHVRAREQGLDVLDAERKTVARLTLLDADGTARSAGVRAELAGLRGYDRELEDVRARLVEELGFVPARHDLADELAGPDAPRGTVAGIRRGQAAGDATSAVLTHLLDVIEANLDGTLRDIDTEFLHDLRVAVRRSRSVQKELRGVFDPGELDAFRAEFRWLQEVTGPTRDLDVWLLEFEDYRALVDPRFRSDLDPVLGLLRVRRQRAFRAMRRALRSERAGTLRDGWRRFLAGLPARAPGPADAKRPIEELAGPRIDRVYRRIVTGGQAIEESSPAQALHDLRKKGKELRYLLELFGAPIYGEEKVRPLVKTLKGLQDVLGRHQDRAVQAAMVSSLRDELAGRPAALVAMGALAQALIDDERAARGEFARRFEDFASRRTRALLKEALR